MKTITTYRCEYCGQIFDRESSATYHEERAHALPVAGAKIELVGREVLFDACAQDVSDGWNFSYEIGAMHPDCIAVTFASKEYANSNPSKVMYVKKETVDRMIADAVNKYDRGL